MSLSITVPQLFYDFIARIIPGLLFILSLDFMLSKNPSEAIRQIAMANNSMAVILIPILIGFLAYIIGWVLYIFTFRSLSKEIRQKHQARLNQGSIKLTEMYQRIRIKNEAVGFRIVKLRAEARMLEASRSGMIYIFFITLGYVLLGRLGYVSLLGQNTLFWIIKLSITVILAGAFWKGEKRAWNFYNGNVSKCYAILFEEIEDTLEEE